VSNATIAALIAALSGLTGGILAATATRWAERYRISQALLDKAEERRLSSIEAFMLATTAWLDWLEYIEGQGWDDTPDKRVEYNRRDKARDEAYRRLLLLASDKLHHWLVEEYKPIELKARNVYADQLRKVGRPNAAGKAARKAYSQLLSKEFVTLARTEVQGLRDPRKLHIR
jgi:hypothetical protein